MSTTFANTIDSNPIYAKRAEQDKDGNQIDNTYAKSSSLATVATSGSYNDLSDKPTIPAAQVQSDWTEADSSYPSFIQNKPTLATVATSGSYNDLADKPTIPSVPVQDVTVDGTSVVSNGTAAITMPTELVPSVTSSDDGKVLKATYSGGVGSYSWETESGGGSLPSSTSADEGKVLTVDANGDPNWAMPAVTSVHLITVT